MVNWDYYEKFEKLNDKYLNDEGEGDTMATQICTAVNKLIYNWYNNGDVFDNTCLGGVLDGYNDLSPYANWLYNNIPQSRDIFDKFKDCITESEYEDLLKELADKLLTEDILEKYSAFEKESTIYEADGPFRVSEQTECEDEY